MDNSNRTFVSSILFIDIVEYSKQSVTDQMTLKQRFNDLLVDALKHVALTDRIVLDTGDGAAVSFQGNPEDSLFAAMHMRDALVAAPRNLLPRLDVRFGINLGPVRLIKDINGQINIIGDGINVAQRVMSFADAGIILVSRSYYEVVSRLSDDYAKIFQDAGTRTDKHVREHAVYAIGNVPESITASVQPHSSTASVARADDAGSDDKGGKDGTAASSVPGKMLKRAVIGGAALLVIVAAAIGLRAGTGGGSAGLSKTEAATVTPVPTTAPKTVEHKARTSLAAVDNKESKPPVASPPTAAKPAAKSPVQLTIKPWGEVYVDGKMKGVSPPLKSLSLTPGTHTIEVRNTTFPSLVKTFDAKPGVETRITHKF